MVLVAGSCGVAYFVVNLLSPAHFAQTLCDEYRNGDYYFSATYSWKALHSWFRGNEVFAEANFLETGRICREND